jgi:hypothetical protein
MIRIEDGNIVINTVEENITAAFNAFVAKYPSISRTQFDGSKEYEIAYMMAQLDVMNGALVQSALETNLNSAALISEKFNLPNVLQSRFYDVMLENGFVAAQKTPPDAGYMKAAVSLTKADGTALDATVGSSDFYALVDLLGGKLLPSGILSDVDVLAPDVATASYLAGETEIPITWAWGTAPADQLAVFFNVTISATGTPPIGYGDIVRGVINEKWNKLNKIGGEITPQLYFPISSIAWAKSVKVEFSIKAKDYDITTITDWSATPQAVDYWVEHYFLATSKYIQITVS